MANYIFRLKRGQSTSWVDQNIILAAGEPGVELDTHRMKVGDGVTAWKDLPYTGISADEARAIASETTHLNRVIVNSLDEIDITTPGAEKVIYMVPNIEPEGANTYDEYMIISGVLESIGTTKTDLLDYVSKVEAFENRPDWNQNDPNAANFIKNRICYSHDKGEETLFLESIIIDEEYSARENRIKNKIFKNGATYRIIINEEEYICSAKIVSYAGIGYGILVGHRDCPLHFFAIPYQVAAAAELGYTEDCIVISRKNSSDKNIYICKIFEQDFQYIEDTNGNKQNLAFSFPVIEGFSGFDRAGLANIGNPTLELKENQYYKVTINGYDYFYKGIYKKGEFNGIFFEGICLGLEPGDSLYVEYYAPCSIYPNVYFPMLDTYIDGCIFYDRFYQHEDLQFNLSMEIVPISTIYYKNIDRNYLPSLDWNENNPKKGGFIENRPCYYPSDDYHIEKRIVGQNDEVFSHMESGKKYIVELGEKYKSPALEAQQMESEGYKVSVIGDWLAVLYDAPYIYGFIVSVWGYEGGSNLNFQLQVTDQMLLLKTMNASSIEELKAAYQTSACVYSEEIVGTPGKTLDPALLPPDLEIKADYVNLPIETGKLYNNSNTVVEALNNIIIPKENRLQYLLDAESQIDSIILTKDEIILYKYNILSKMDKTDMRQYLTNTGVPCSGVPWFCSNQDNTIISCSSASYMSASYDGGITWEKIESAVLPSLDATTNIFYENGYFFCGSYSSSVYYSKDAKNWTKILYDNNVYIQDVLNNGDLWIICGKNKIITSNNFIRWQTITLPEEYVYKAVIFNGEKYLLYTEHGLVYESVNGIDWKFTFTLPFLPASIIKGNYNYIFKDSDNNIYYSEDGIEWSQLPFTNVKDCVYDISNNHYYIVDESDFLTEIWLENATNLIQKKDLLPLKQQLNNLQNDFDTSFNYLILKDQKTGLNYVLEIHNGNIITYSKFTDIEILDMPAITTYTPEDTFNPEGMIVALVNEDGTQVITDNYEYYTGILSQLDVPDLGIYDFKISCRSGDKIISTFIPLTFKNEQALQDFTYSIQDDIYIIEEWKQTLDGKANTTDLVVPSGNLIKI